LRASSAWFRKTIFGFSISAMRTSCAGHRRLASGYDLRSVFEKKVVPRQTFAQQHSGDWAMTGKVPVARAESQPLLPAPNRKDEGHPAHQDHGRIAGR
jgi:hypothetical protein